MGVTVRTRKLKEGKITLFLDIIVDGVRSYEFLGLKCKEKPRNNFEKDEAKAVRRKAEMVRRKRQDEIENQTLNLVAGGDKIGYLTYFESLSKNYSSNATWENTLKHLRKYTSKDTRLDKISLEWIKGFIKYLDSSNLKTNSRRTYYSKVQGSLAQAVRDGLINHNPTKRLKMPWSYEDVQVQYLTQDQISELFKTDYGESHVKRAFLLSCLTGLRGSDVRRLTWENLRDGRLVISQKKTSTPLVYR